MSPVRSLMPDIVVSSIVTLQLYMPSSPSIKNLKQRVLRKLLPPEVVGPMVTLSSVIILAPPGHL